MFISSTLQLASDDVPPRRSTRLQKLRESIPQAYGGCTSSESDVSTSDTSSSSKTTNLSAGETFQEHTNEHQGLRIGSPDPDLVDSQDMLQEVFAPPRDSSREGESSESEDDDEDDGYYTEGFRWPEELMYNSNRFGKKKCTWKSNRRGRKGIEGGTCLKDMAEFPEAGAEIFEGAADFVEGAAEYLEGGAQWAEDGRLRPRGGGQELRGVGRSSPQRILGNSNMTGSTTWNGCTPAQRNTPAQEGIRYCSSNFNFFRGGMLS